MIELSGGELGCFFSFFGQGGFDATNSSCETPGGVPTSGFSVDSPVAGEVHEREKYVSQLSGEGGARAFCLCDLSELFPELCGNTPFRVGPVKANTGGPLLQILGKKKGGKMKGDTIEGASAGRLFGFFKLMPALEDLLGGGEALFPKDVGVAADQLFGELLGDFLKIEGAALLGQLGVENNVKKDVPQLFLKGLVVFLIDRFEQLVDFLEKHGAKSLVGLLLIPRATTGSAEASYDLGKGANFFHSMDVRRRRSFVESERDSSRKSSSLFFP